MFELARHPLETFGALTEPEDKRADREAGDAEDSIGEVIREIDARSRYHNDMIELWHGYVADELELSRRGAVAAVDRMSNLSGLSLEQRSRLEATPQGSVVSVAQKVLQGLTNTPGTYFRTTTADMDAFLRFAADFHPEGSVESLGFSMDETAIFYRAIWQRFDN